MTTLKEYITKELGYVSKWWKFAFIALVVIEVLSFLFCSYFYEGTGDLGELYFNFHNKIFYIGLME